MRALAVFLFALLTGASAGAQTAPPAAPPADYVGTYRNATDHVLEIAAGDTLFAVLDEAKYVLQPSGKDVFRTAGGSTVVFHRNAQGAVVDCEENGHRRTRSSPQVSAAAQSLASPRPHGAEAPAAYRYVAPPDLHDGIAVGDIARTRLGVETARRIVDGVVDGTYKDVHGVLLYQDGRLVMEEYFYGYDATRQHQLRSATKSFVGALAGIATAQGALSGAGERVLPRLSYSAYAHPSPLKDKLTLGDFLSMSPGLACNDYDPSSPGREMVIEDADDWVKATLDQPMLVEPGTVAHYCTGGVAVVARVTENAVHQPLAEFARRNLFEPLGIARADWQWNVTLTNANQEYAQLHMRPRDMLKFGLVYANGGRWQGKQIVPEAWVTATLAQQSLLDGTGYGYFWWRPWMNVALPTGEKHVYVHAVQGNGGQKIYLVPEYGLVAVFTGGDYNSGSAPPNKIMATLILPKLLAEAPRP